jgi:hypothetical protein
MAYAAPTYLPAKSSSDPNASADVNLLNDAIVQAQANIDIVKGGTAGVTPFIPLETLKSFLKCVNGLGISNNSGDAAKDIDIAVGACMDSTFVHLLTLASGLTKQLDAGWAVGTAAGGLDTGSVAASTTYHVWIIRKDSDGTIDALFSLSATAPTMPAGYTYKRVIGCIRTDSSSNILAFYQTGNRFRFKAQQADRAYGALANTSRIAVTVSTPENLTGIFNVEAVYLTTAAAHYLIAQATTETDSAASATNNTHHVYVNGANNSVEMEILVDNSRQIAIRGTSTSISCGIRACGWIDHRI